ncbi:Okp1p Ecym_6013 [Eremothecium cymbalariae DBVPG|uniref:Uncharacterized protein n=1 Tax=Eremothecium cymbalariae (strain CBS 270.75 / DBVPG 7215 / KCTC 17166 / NRRL Y-17582) TaxID=931890 RepID=G8JUU2_ERECY|nr:hypothetical protein Ecym_6013 [Eremothecium cymbalariae DBVPG\
MSKNILDEILSDSDISKDEDEGSMASLNADAFRLDGKQPTDGNGNMELFVRDEDSSPLGKETANSNQVYRSISEDGSDEVSDIKTPPRERKRVRFNAGQDAETDKDDDELNPWDLKRAVRKQFKEKLPENYEIKTWKRPPKHLIRSLLEIMEGNVERAAEDVMNKYSDECIHTLGPEEFEKFQEDKKQVLFNMIGKLRSRLKRTKFPSRISDHALDIEYIYTKRNFIQQRYETELDNTEKVELQLVEEQQVLATIKNQASQATAKQLLEQLTADLHPSLNKAISNAYGLIKDQENTRETYLRDVDNLNLKPSISDA